MNLGHSIGSTAHTNDRENIMYPINDTPSYAYCIVKLITEYSEGYSRELE